MAALAETYEIYLYWSLKNKLENAPLIEMYTF